MELAFVLHPLLHRHRMFAGSRPPPGIHLVNQGVATATGRDQRIGWRGVSRNDDGLAAYVEAVSQCFLPGSMLYEECLHADVPVLIDISRLYVVRLDSVTRRVAALQSGCAHLNVFLKGLKNM